MKCTNCGESNAGNRSRCVTCGQGLPDASGETLFDADDLTYDDQRSPLAAQTARDRQVSRTRKASAESPTEHVPSRSRKGTSGSGSFGSSSGSGSGSGSRSRSSTGVLAPSTIFGNRCEILELVGEGGMGQVCKAPDKELDRVIALKTIRVEKETDPETVQRFKRELLLARKITHKNVAALDAGGRSEAATLRKWLKTPGAAASGS